MKKTGQLSDVTLVANYQSGDKSALPILVKRWHLKFCKFAFWIVKDADVAKDIAQESWTAIMIKIHDLKEPEKFKSWAISIVNRKAIDWIRTKNRENNKLVKFYNENPKVQESNVFEDNQKLKLLILNSINALSNEHQTVVKLFYTESYTLKEISEILEISIGTAKSRLFHAREKLKLILKHRNYEN
jgi:RNA polymerase sigma-70 factor (ECF subfamily)